jgi:ACT domain-containing protein
MQGKFTMLMLCDLSNSKYTLKELKNNLVELGEQIGVSIHVQHEDIFNAMHKI